MHRRRQLMRRRLSSRVPTPAADSGLGKLVIRVPDPLAVTRVTSKFSEVQRKISEVVGTLPRLLRFHVYLVANEHSTFWTLIDENSYALGVIGVLGISGEPTRGVGGLTSPLHSGLRVSLMFDCTQIRSFVQIAHFRY